MGYYDTIAKAKQAEQMQAKQLYESGIEDGAKIGAARAAQLFEQKLQNQMRPQVYSTGKLGMSPQIVQRMSAYNQQIQQQERSPITAAAQQILQEIL